MASVRADAWMLVARLVALVCRTLLMDSLSHNANQDTYVLWKLHPHSNSNVVEWGVMERKMKIQDLQ